LGADFFLLLLLLCLDFVLNMKFVPKQPVGEVLGRDARLQNRV